MAECAKKSNYVLGRLLGEIVPIRLAARTIGGLKTRIKEMLKVVSFATRVEESNDISGYNRSIDDVTAEIIRTCEDMVRLETKSNNRRLITFPITDVERAEIRDTVRSIMSNKGEVTIQADVLRIYGLDFQIIDVDEFEGVRYKEAVNNTYGDNSFIDSFRRIDLNRDMRHALVMDVNGTNPQVVNSIKTMNESIAKYKNAQYKLLRDFLIKKGFDWRLLPETMYDESTLVLDPSYENALIAMANYIKQQRVNGTFDTLLDQEFNNKDVSYRGPHDMLDAVNAYVTIGWFDLSLVETLGRLIRINDGMNDLKLERSLDTGKLPTIYKYSLSFDRLTNESHVFGDEYLDAMKEQGKYSIMLINSIPVHDYHETANRSISLSRTLSLAEFLSAFTRLADVALTLKPGIANGEFLSHLSLSYKDPTHLLEALRILFLKNDVGDSIRDLFVRRGVMDDVFNVLYSTYRALYVGDNGKNNSWSALEQSFLAKNGFLSRFNTVDTILGAILSYVRISYLNSEYDANIGRMVTSTYQRGFYKRDMYDIIKSINNNTVRRVNKESVLQRYRINGSSGEFTLRIGEDLVLNINTKNDVFLYKPISGQAELSIDGDPEVIDAMREINLELNNRSRLINGTDLLPYELQFMQILLFVDEMLGTRFSLSTVGLLELNMMRNMNSGSNTFVDLTMSAARALMVTKIYNAMEGNENYGLTSIREFLGTDRLLDAYSYDMSKISSDDSWIYFFKSTLGEQISSVNVRLLWILNLSSARNIINGGSLASTSFNLSNERVPTYSPTFHSMRLLSEMANLSDNSVRRFNMFARSRASAIKRMTVDMEVTLPNGKTTRVSLMNWPESTMHAIIDRFCAPLLADNADSVYIQYTGVADKAKIPIAEVDLNSFVPKIKDNDKLPLIKRLVHSNYASWATLQIGLTIGATYNLIWRNVIEDYEKIAQWMRQGENPLVGQVTPLSIQVWLKLHTVEDLMRCVDQYNATNTVGEHLELLQDLHYRVNGEHVTLNELLYDYITNTYRARLDTDGITDVYDNIADRLNEERRNFILGLCDNSIRFEIEYDTHNRLDAHGNTMTQFMRKAGINEKYWISDNNMILARVNRNGQDIPVLYGKIPEGVITLNPILEAYFLTNVLVGNNIRLGSIGSEVNSDINVSVPPELLNHQSFYEHYAPSSEAITLADISMALLAYDAAPEVGYSADAKIIRLQYKNAIRTVESDAVLQLNKRAIPESTTIRPYLQGTRGGILPTMKVAVIEDVYGKVWTPMNPTDEEIATGDGLAYLNPLMYWLLDDAALDMHVGYVQKPFWHAYLDRYGTAALVKFGLMTYHNAMMRESENAIIPMYTHFKKTSNERWNGRVDLTGTSALLIDPSKPNATAGRILFRKHGLMQKRLFYQDSNRLHHEIINLGKEVVDGINVYYTEEFDCDSNGLHSAGANAHHVYHVFDTKSNHLRVESRNTALLLLLSGQHTIDSLYEFHAALGGIYAEELDANNILIYSEHNNHVVANYMKLVTDANGVLVLKDALLAMTILPSSMKKGVANINSAEAWTNEDVPLRYQVLDTTHYGLQLDSDEDPSSGAVREMSLMMVAISSGGVMQNETRSVYNTVEQIMRDMSSDVIDAYNRWRDSGRLDRSPIYDLMTRIVMLRYRGDRANGVGQALINRVSRVINQNEDHSKDAFMLPFSDPLISALSFSSLSGHVNANSFERRFKGIGNVTVTAYNMNMLYDIDGYVCQFSDLLRMAQESGLVVADDRIVDLALRNRDFVRRFLQFKQDLYSANPENIYRDVERFDPSDNVLCKFIDADNNALQLVISLDSIEDYYSFKANPINFLALRMYGVMGVDTGNGVLVINTPNNWTPEQVDAAMRNIAAMTASITYQQSIATPRNLKNRNLKWRYYDGTRYVYMNVYDDYRIKDNRVGDDGKEIYDRQSLYDDLARGVYRPLNSTLEYRVEDLSSTPMENMMSYMYENELPISGRSMQWIQQEYNQGRNPFFYIPEPAFTYGYDMALVRQDGNNLFINFGATAKGELLQWKNTIKRKGQDGIYNHIYAIDGNGKVLYEIGREIAVNNVIYDNGRFIESTVDEQGNPLTNTYVEGQKYKLLDDGKTVGRYYEFLTRSKVYSGTKNTILYNIDGYGLGSVLATGETLGDVVASLVNDIYGAGNYEGIQLNHNVSTLSHSMFTLIIEPLIERMRCNRSLARYLLDVRNVISKPIILTYAALQYNDEAMDQALRSYYKDLAELRYSTFLVVRDTNQARIPGLGMLSFLETRTVALYHTGLNQVAISHWEMLLLGSDKDNDHAWHMAYDVDGAGRFVGWSDIFDYTTEDGLKASKELPFPVTGKEYSWGGYEIPSDQIEAIMANLSTAERISKVAKLISYLDDNHISNVQYDTSLDPQRLIFRLLDRHQKTVIPLSLLIAALRNYVASRVASIALGLRNQVNALIPTGMPTIKRLGESQKRIGSLLDPSHMLYMQAMNLMAKKDVGIMANGSNGAFRWHYYLNELARDPDRAKAEKYGLFKFTLTRVIGRSRGELEEKTILTLPDVNIEGNTNGAFTNAVRLSQLMRVEQYISEYITAATDNAKDPKLVSINAHAFADMHLLLATMGVSLEDIISFMTSPVAKFISEISLNNGYNDYTFSLEDVIAIARGDYSPVVKKVIGKKWGAWLSTAEYNQLCKGDTNIAISTDYGSVRFKRRADIKYAIDALKARLNYDVNSKDNLADVDEFVNINEAALEFTTFAITLGKIRKVDTSLQDWINTLLQFKRNFLARIEAVNKLRQIENAAIKERNKTNAVKEPLLELEDETPLDMQRYLEDENYRQSIIDRYNEVKKCLNFFDALEYIPQYRATRDIMAATFGMLELSSILLRTYRTVTDKLSATYLKNIDERARNAIFGSTMNIFINEFLATFKHPETGKQLLFPYISGSTLLDAGANAITMNNGGLFYLDKGNNIASFKLIFEEQLIPLLKDGKIFADGGIGIREIGELKGNYFIQGLMRSSSDNVPIERVGLDMYNLDGTPETIREFALLLKGLMLLQNIKMNGVSLADWFTVYNLVVNKNRSGRDRMTALFEPFVEREGSLMSEYYTWLGKMDNSDAKLSYVLEDILYAAAPIVSSTNGQTAPYIILMTDNGAELYARDRWGNYDKAKGSLIPKLSNETTENYVKRLQLYLDYFVTGGAYMIDIKNTIDTLMLENMNIILDGEVVRNPEDILRCVDVLSDLMYRKVILGIEKIC